MLNVNGEQIDRIVFRKTRNGVSTYESDVYGLRYGGAARWARPCQVKVSSNIYSSALTLSLNLYDPAPGAPARAARSEIAIDKANTFTAYAGDTFGWELRSSDPSYRVNAASGSLSIKPGADGVLTDSYSSALRLSVTRLADGPELICYAGTNTPDTPSSSDKNLLIKVENPNSTAYRFYGKAIVRWQVKSSFAGGGSRLRELTVHSFGGDTISRASTLSEASPASASAGDLAAGGIGSTILPGGGIVSPGGGGVVIPPGGIVGPGGGIVGPGGGSMRLPYELTAPSSTLEPHSWIIQGAFWSLSQSTTLPPISVITQDSGGDLNLGYEFAGDDNEALVSEFNSLVPHGEELNA